MKPLSRTITIEGKQVKVLYCKSCGTIYPITSQILAEQCCMTIRCKSATGEGKCFNCNYVDCSNPEIKISLKECKEQECIDCKYRICNVMNVTLRR